eukprot:Awhi_evm1s3167
MPTSTLKATSSAIFPDNCDNNNSNFDHTRDIYNREPGLGSVVLNNNYSNSINANTSNNNSNNNTSSTYTPTATIANNNINDLKNSENNNYKNSYSFHNNHDDDNYSGSNYDNNCKGIDRNNITNNLNSTGNINTTTTSTFTTTSTITNSFNNCNNNNNDNNSNNNDNIINSNENSNGDDNFHTDHNPSSTPSHILQQPSGSPLPTPDGFTRRSQRNLNKAKKKISPSPPPRRSTGGRTTGGIEGDLVRSRRSTKKKRKDGPKMKTSIIHTTSPSVRLLPSQHSAPAISIAAEEVINDSVHNTDDITMIDDDDDDVNRDNNERRLPMELDGPDNSNSSTGNAVEIVDDPEV